MIKLLTGENEFMVLAEQNRLIAEFLKKHDTFGLERIDAADVELSALRDALLQLPFLVSKKMVVIRSVFSQRAVVELIDELYEKIPDEIDVVLVDSKADKRVRLYKQLQANKAVGEFVSLKGAALSKWVVDYAKTLNAEISQKDADFLVNRVGPSQMILAREIEKLAIDMTITQEVIESRTDQQLQATIFELLDAVFSGNRDKTFAIYDELLTQKTDPSEIMPLIAWQLNIFAVVQYSNSKNSGDIAKAAKIHPFVAGKAVKAVAGISKQQLKTAVTMTLEADLKLKTSSGDPEDVLRVLLLKLTSL